MRRLLFKQLDPRGNFKEGTSLFNYVIISLIIISVFTQVMETDLEIYEEYKYFFRNMDWILAIVFTLEYILRIWVSVELLHPDSDLKCRIRFMLTPVMIIDLLTLIPFYMTLGSSDILWLRFIRALKILSLAKFGRVSVAFKVLFSAIKERRYELGATLMLVVTLLLISSTALYIAERDVQPEAFGSIPKSMWWSVITLTAVGYGDVHPITSLGKFMAGITAIIGIALFAIPTGILAASFSDMFQKKKERIRERNNNRSN